ncbi:uncharacterized protein KGF55_005429 [Candida pseudojiufengensis]|uniref:uncharacterized protein n=1 Tax=Candida pseudojiufengensis TaxID=497109 RepID=UPI0022255EB1|nr:uncharacterized protein KGF55_005429 [Candida pseudojiufengensis]KAI5959279.1 hypothetical protein KGF55_005429 [Candida pseudojiufengensis]
MSNKTPIVEKTNSFTNENPLKETSSVSSSSTFELFNEKDANKVYLLKSKILAEAIEEIGYGRYQIGLFIVCGFGWFNDNAFPIATSLLIPRLIEVDGVIAPVGRVAYVVLAQNLGLLFGCVLFSLMSDFVGRKLPFQLTLLITSIFAIISGASPNFAALGCFVAFYSVGVGGNIVVDASLFLESIPASDQWVLTVMSLWWALAGVITNLFSWGLISNYSCAELTNCYKNDNKGWRYFMFTIGGFTFILFVIRFCFRVYESPKYYLGIGQDMKAIEVVERIAKTNRKPCPITIEDFQEIDRKYGEIDEGKDALIKKNLAKFDGENFKKMFSSPKLTISNVLIIITWSVIGIAYPLYNSFLPYYLETRGDATKPLSVHETYRNSLIVSVIGIPGALIAGLLVELRTGRKGALSISLLLTGVVLFGSTTAKSSGSYLAWNCFFSLFSNIQYGVLYAYTPEICHVQIRALVFGLASSCNRIMSIFAPIINIFADLTTSVPIFVAGALFLAAGVFVVFFPYEPRGKKSL